MAQFYERGDIKHKGRARQLNSFSGMIRRRNITPTDIDGIIDYGGRAFIILEGKYGDAELPKGQRMALENLANTILSSNKKCAILIYRHYIHNTESEINVSQQLVTEIYWKRKWEKTIKETTVLQAIEMFENHCDNNNYII